LQNATGNLPEFYVCVPSRESADIPKHTRPNAHAYRAHVDEHGKGPAYFQLDVPQASNQTAGLIAIKTSPNIEKLIKELPRRQRHRERERERERDVLLISTLVLCVFGTEMPTISIRYSLKGKYRCTFLVPGTRTAPFIYLSDEEIAKELPYPAHPRRAFSSLIYHTFPFLPFAWPPPVPLRRSV